MSDPQPPAPPPPPSSGFIDRLLEVGNHNKVIAAATLITLATGVPYLVMSAVGAFSDEESVEALVEDAIGKALEEFGQKLAQYEADKSGPTPIDTGDAEDSFAGLKEEALRPGATRAEQDRIIEAVIQYSAGNSEPAIAEFERIATAQEMRGAQEDAARTLRRRGALRSLENEPAALADYERAESLAPGAAADWGRVAGLRTVTGDYEGASDAAQVAIGLARAEGDTATLVDALLLSFGVGVHDTPAKRQAVIAAAEEASTLLRSRLAAAPQDFEAFEKLVAARSGRAGALLESELQSEAIRAEARGLYERLDALDPAAVDTEKLAFCATQVACFAASYASLEEDGGVNAEVAAWAAEALEEMERRLGRLSGADETQALQIEAAILTAALTEDEPRTRRILALSRAAAERTLGYAPESVEAASAVGLTMFTEAAVLVRMGDLDGAVQAFAETLRWLEGTEVLTEWRQATGVDALLNATFGKMLAGEDDARAAWYVEQAEALLEAAGEEQGFTPVTRDNIAAARELLVAPPRESPVE